MDDSSRSPLPVLEPTDYHCPGDRRPVTRAVHLARLASGHRACRQCERRTETGSLPRSVVRQLQTSSDAPSFLFHPDEGIRGLYINELTRERMERIVRCLLDVADLERRTQERQNYRSTGAMSVLVGFDSRPDSPDLAIGVVQALQQSSAEIIDAGQVSRPAFDFAVDRFRPHLGLYVTGGVRPAAWTGLDLIDTQSLPWLTDERQAALQERLSQPVPRTGRTAGHNQTVEIQGEYETRLVSLFHALRPLRVGIACPEVNAHQTLQRLLARTPCDVHFLSPHPQPLSPVEPPVRRGQPVQGRGELGSRVSEQGGRSLADLICERHLDLGIAIALDGRACRIYDETGTELAVDDLVSLLTLPYSDLTDAERKRPREIRETCSTERERRLQQREENLPVLADEAGRCWFLEESPTCDAVQTLARVLEVLSLSERLISHIRTQPAAKISSRG